MVTADELSIDTVREGTTATEMAETIFGAGVEVVGATYNGDGRSAGIYTEGTSVTPGDSGIILSTGRAEDFTNSSGDANQQTNTSSNTTGPNNVPDFNEAAGARTYDAAYMDIDFIPEGDVMTMEFVFSSEEYAEFSNSVYQDFVMVWINGVEVPLSFGNGDIDPGNVNAGVNENLFIDNSDSAVNSEMDGLTITLSLTIPVVSGEVNSIRIAIADVADNRYDSSLLIGADSVQTELVAVDDETNLYPDGTKTIDVLSNDINSNGAALTITHLNGIEVAPGDTITLATGQEVTLNANGTLTLKGDGTPEDFNFTYAIAGGGLSDTGIVNVGSIPCFTAGTMIATPTGECAVEMLQPGDLVLTKDDGPQPLRWCGQRTVRAEGAYAPIHVQAGAFGDHRALVVSPEHRIMLHDPLAEFLFGETEVLVAAKYLINDHSVRRRMGGFVTYVHLMFDHHQVVFSDGLATESFLPGPQTKDVFEQDVIEEICSLFPELDPATGEGYGVAARRTLSRYEAAIWKSGILAA